MDLVNRTTITKTLPFDGVSLREKKPTRVHITPHTHPGEGILFERNNTLIPASYEFSHINRTPFWSTRYLEKEQQQVVMPEHILAALRLAGITDATIHLETQWVPTFSDNITTLVKQLQRHRQEFEGIPLLHLTFNPANIDHPEKINLGIPGQPDSCVVMPSNGLSIDYLVGFPDSLFAKKTFSIDDTNSVSAVAAAQPPYWKGGVINRARDIVLHTLAYPTHGKTLIPLFTRFYEPIHRYDKPHYPEDRLAERADELANVADSDQLSLIEPHSRQHEWDTLAYHKICDFIGDIALAQHPFIGMHFSINRTGHEAHDYFIQQLSVRRALHYALVTKPDESGQRTITPLDDAEVYIFRHWMLENSIIE